MSIDDGEGLGNNPIDARLNNPHLGQTMFNYILVSPVTPSGDLDTATNNKGRFLLRNGCPVLAIGSVDSGGKQV